MPATSLLFDLAKSTAHSLPTFFKFFLIEQKLSLLLMLPKYYYVVQIKVDQICEARVIYSEDSKACIIFVDDVWRKKTTVTA